MSTATIIGRLMPPAQLPGQVELACPTGAQVVQPIGQTYNASTGKYRQWLCVDGNGNITQASGIVSFPLLSPTNGSAGGPIYSFVNQAGSGLYITGSGPAISQSSVQVALFSQTGGVAAKISFPTTSFASLPAVPAAGVASLYCTDCTAAATCAGAGTGHLAVSNGTNWTCQ